MMAVRPKRGARFGRTMHPQQTRLVAFRKPDRKGEADSGHGPFDWLGFTHDWTQSRRGYGVIKRVTAKKRRRRAMKAVGRWCRHHRHDPRREQYRQRSRGLRGHEQYDGIRGHDRKLEALFTSVETAWRY
jgi:RNA-directed DNA polymerase